MAEKEEKREHSPRVMFAGEPGTRPSASSPMGATSPRALKILSRKKTPFTEDLQSSLEAFREIEAAHAVLEAQKEVRGEEAGRLKELGNREPVVLVKREEDGERRSDKSVTVVSPPCATERRLQGKALSELQKDTAGVPKSLADPTKNNK